MLRKKKSLRDKVRASNATVEADYDTGKKIVDYRSTVELTGEQIATLQNLMSYLMTDGQEIMFALSPNPMSTLSTIDMVQTELKKMAKELDMKLPEGSKVSAQSIVDGAKKAMEEN